MIPKVTDHRVFTLLINYSIMDRVCSIYEYIIQVWVEYSNLKVHYSIMDRVFIYEYTSQLWMNYSVMNEYSLFNCGYSFPIYG